VDGDTVPNWTPEGSTAYFGKCYLAIFCLLQTIETCSTILGEQVMIFQGKARFCLSFHHHPMHLTPSVGRAAHTHQSLAGGKCHWGILLRPQGALIEAKVLWWKPLHWFSASLPQCLHHKSRSHQVAGSFQIQVEVVPEALQSEVQCVAPQLGHRSPPSLVMHYFVGHKISPVVNLVGRHQVILWNQKSGGGWVILRFWKESKSLRT
jgi:hypothetical protein